MTPDQHRHKAERIERSLEKCGEEHYELAIEGAMLAGSHWFNYALHRMELKAGDNDTMHAQYLSGADRLKIALLQPEMLNAMEEIESSRALYVRGSMPGGVAAGNRSRDLLAVIRTAALQSRPFRG